MEVSEAERTVMQQWRFLQQRSGGAPTGGGGGEETRTPFERAELTRRLMEMPRLAAALNLVKLGDVEHLTLDIGDSYASLVNDPAGVNNFADAALAHSEGRRNESKAWTSSLTPARMREMPCVQRFLEASRRARENFVPDEKKNVPLFTRSSNETKPNVSAAPAARHGQVAAQPQQPFRSEQPAEQPEKRSTRSPWDENQPQSRIAEQRFPLTCPRRLFKPRGTPPPPTRVTAPPTAHPLPDASAHQDLRPRNPMSGHRIFRPSEPQKRPFSHVDADDESDDDLTPAPVGAFKTAREQLAIDQHKKYAPRGGSAAAQVSTASYGQVKKSLGTRRGINSKFVPPVMNREESAGDRGGGALVRRATPGGGAGATGERSGLSEAVAELLSDERLRNIDPRMVELVCSDIMDQELRVAWDDIAGLEFAKKTVKEILIVPMLRPDIFTGIRAPPKGLLLFGPPGTGKTLIGRCIASQAKCTFFCISASTLTSKWVGDGEKMVRALFAVARVHEPAVVFIDEIDSLLAQRGDGDHDSMRRIKTEFLVQLDGAATSAEERLLVVGATNRPQEIDEAARRRFVKRLYIPLPEADGRQHIVHNLLREQKHDLTDQQVREIADETSGFSGADMATLVREAAMGPIRGMSIDDIARITADQVRPITRGDFTDALTRVKPSVSQLDLGLYEKWNRQFGSWQMA